jgi:hypothetical protein
MSKNISIDKIIEVAPALSPLSKFVDHFEIGEWKDVHKYDREVDPPKRLEETEPRLTVWIALADLNLEVLNRTKNADNTPAVKVKRDGDGRPELVKYPYTNPETGRKSWSPKVQGFFLSGDDYKEFRQLAPLAVWVLIKGGHIK